MKSIAGDSQNAKRRIVIKATNGSDRAVALWVFLRSYSLNHPNPVQRDRVELPAATIAHHMGWSRRKVHHAINDLRTRRLLARSTGRRGHGGFTRLQLLFPSDVQMCTPNDPYKDISPSPTSDGSAVQRQPRSQTAKDKPTPRQRRLNTATARIQRLCTAKGWNNRSQLINGFGHLNPPPCVELDIDTAGGWVTHRHKMSSLDPHRARRRTMMMIRQLLSQWDNRPLFDDMGVDVARIFGLMVWRWDWDSKRTLTLARAVSMSTILPELSAYAGKAKRWAAVVSWITKWTLPPAPACNWTCALRRDVDTEGDGQARADHGTDVDPVAGVSVDAVTCPRAGQLHGSLSAVDDELM